jgi:integrase
MEIGIKTYLDYEDTANRLLDYFGNYCPLHQIQKENCAKFISNLKSVDPNHIDKNKSLADSTRRKILRNSSTLFKTAAEWGYNVTPGLFSGISVKKPRTMPWYYISNFEFKKILENTPSLRLQAMYSLCYGCGLRLGEMQNIIADQNFDFQKKQVKLINRPGTSDIPPFQLKDYEERTIPLPQWVLEILSQWWLKADSSVPFLFLTGARWEIVKFKWQEMLSRGEQDDWRNEKMMNNCLRDFKLYCKKAGIRTSLKINIQGLRRSYATCLANSGEVPPHTLQKLLGHSDVKTSMDYYVGHSDANSERAVEALDRLMGEAG